MFKIFILSIGILIFGVYIKLNETSTPINNISCLESLKKLDIVFKKQADFKESSKCKVENAVRLTRVGGITLDNSPLLTCSMVKQLTLFENKFIQPLAKRLFNSEIKRIKHLGTYNCRSMRQFTSIPSQHSFANALDVSSFITEDNQEINIEKHWKTSGNKGKFLRKIALDACKVFQVAVSPNKDANHYNHFHWDMAPYRNCY
tara:strand:- start:601 stop:1209 length:609 start_codon:yes stop_codon:yes gene_type:complete